MTSLSQSLVFTVTSRDSGGPGIAVNYITKTQQFSSFRYGLLGEVSCKFQGTFRLLCALLCLR